MDKGCAFTIVVDVLEIDYELGGVVLGVCKDLGSVERNDVVGDDLNRLRGEVCIVDAQMGIEPINFICNKLARNETL